MRQGWIWGRWRRNHQKISDGWILPPISTKVSSATEDKKAKGETRQHCHLPTRTKPNSDTSELCPEFSKIPKDDYPPRQPWFPSVKRINKIHWPRQTMFDDAFMGPLSKYKYGGFSILKLCFIDGLLPPQSNKNLTGFLVKLWMRQECS